MALFPSIRFSLSLLILFSNWSRCFYQGEPWQSLRKFLEKGTSWLPPQVVNGWETFDDFKGIPKKNRDLSQKQKQKQNPPNFLTLNTRYNTNPKINIILSFLIKVKISSSNSQSGFQYRVLGFLLPSQEIAVWLSFRNSRKKTRTRCKCMMAESGLLLWYKKVGSCEHMGYY